ncbi:hypothetical protein F2P47_16760 [Parvibaculum sedimenti]|uniref:Transposase zinc-ribbon domain-containing protein n=1 Tax=Parvibaculum sedimenti TaxID=2608632 RepID=A0A6N6VJ84_9HYPH|nr:transposase [Parvibaculum sedimenti]KAB7738563.1 hypothetical protein F2P47_16760 [Parvibaculum sedimenti]
MSEQISSTTAFPANLNGVFDRVRQSPTIGEIFESEELSRSLVEAARWPQGPECPSCKSVGAACKLTTRPGLWTCKACRRCQYSATSGTPLHGTRVTIAAWLVLFHAFEVRKQRLSVSQVSHKLNVSYLTAKSMLQRLDQLKTEMPEMADRLRSQLIDLSGRREGVMPAMARMGSVVTGA